MKEQIDGAAVLRKLEAIKEHAASVGYTIGNPNYTGTGTSPQYHLRAIDKYASEIMEMVYAAGLQGDYS